ncbi:hypothetical protein Ahy_B02g059766 [Arachis hypogaea]|uniref:Uncharacterized protein n=1 Tax=Arachis hypogaea TaxID=3818 RepID=A0A445AH90_ARAHY|nr:hypothetical protein Ahy_B02g059766 [Arachis hypogaea]
MFKEEILDFARFLPLLFALLVLCFSLSALVPRSLLHRACSLILNAATRFCRCHYTRMLVSELSVIHVRIVQMEMCGVFQMELMKQLLFSRMLEVSRIKYIFFLLNHYLDWKFGMGMNDELGALCFNRKKRLAETKEAAKVLRFGSVVPISGSDFVREVSQAPSDVWVVVILYKDGALKNLSQDIL